MQLNPLNSPENSPILTTAANIPVQDSPVPDDLRRKVLQETNIRLGKYQVKALIERRSSRGSYHLQRSYDKVGPYWKLPIFNCTCLLKFTPIISYTLNCSIWSLWNPLLIWTFMSCGCFTSKWYCKCVFPHYVNTNYVNFYWLCLRGIPGLKTKPLEGHWENVYEISLIQWSQPLPR